MVAGKHKDPAWLTALEPYIGETVQPDYRRITMWSILETVGSMLRELEGEVYRFDQRRVATYLVEMSNDMVGAGDDPIGFLIASHAELVRRLAGLETVLTMSQEERDTWRDDAGRWRAERDEALGFLFAAKRLGLFLGAAPAGLTEFMEGWKDDGF